VAIGQRATACHGGTRHGVAAVTPLLEVKDRPTFRGLAALLDAGFIVEKGTVFR
jgi:hypothetical protein